MFYYLGKVSPQNVLRFRMTNENSKVFQLTLLFSFIKGHLAINKFHCSMDFIDSYSNSPKSNVIGGCQIQFSNVWQTKCQRHHHNNSKEPRADCELHWSIHYSNYKMFLILNN